MEIATNAGEFLHSFPGGIVVVLLPGYSAKRFSYDQDLLNY
jgi:hypothetical protein